MFWVNLPVGVFGTLWAYRKLRDNGERHRGRIGQNRAEARLDRSEFARVPGVPGRPHPHRAGGVGVGVSRPLVKAPALGVTVGEDRINITGLVRRVRECGEADVERRLNPIPRRCRVMTECRVRDIFKLVHMTQLPVRNPGADSQSRGVREARPRLARCHRAGVDRALQGRSRQKRYQHASLIHV